MKNLMKEYNAVHHVSKTDWGTSIPVIYKNGIGYARLYWYNDDENTIYIEGLDVDEKIRGKAVGTAIMNLLEKIAIKLGKTKILLKCENKSWLYYWYHGLGYNWLKTDIIDNDGWMYKLL